MCLPEYGIDHNESIDDASDSPGEEETEPPETSGNTRLDGALNTVGMTATAGTLRLRGSVRSPLMATVATGGPFELRGAIRAQR